MIVNEENYDPGKGNAILQRQIHQMVVITKIYLRQIRRLTCSRTTEQTGNKGSQPEGLPTASALVLSSQGPRQRRLHLRGACRSVYLLSSSDNDQRNRVGHRRSSLSLIPVMYRVLSAVPVHKHKHLNGAWQITSTAYVQCCCIVRSIACEDAA